MRHLAGLGEGIMLGYVRRDLFLFSSCPIVGRTLLLHFPFKLTLSGYFDLFLCILPLRLFMMLCIVIYYKYSAVSVNKHELIQVIVAANITTHKRLAIRLRTRIDRKADSTQKIIYL